MKRVKLKIVASLMMIILIIGLIVSQLGSKLEQQDYLYNRSELQKLEAKLRELGVDICMVQPISQSRISNGEIYAVLSFEDNDERLIVSKLDEIKSAISDYAKKSDRSLRSPIIRYFDEEGFPLEDTLRSGEKIQSDDIIPEEIVSRYTISLMGKITTAMNNYIEPPDYHIKLFADAKYDVTLDAYSPKQLHFFARFNETNTEKLKAIRIDYKKISGFNEDRGDTIHFYNMSEFEYNIIDSLAKEISMIRSNPSKNPKAMTVFFKPINLEDFILSNKADRMVIQTPLPDTSPHVPTPSATLLQTPGIDIPVGTASPIISPSLDPAAKSE